MTKRPILWISILGGGIVLLSFLFWTVRSPEDRGDAAGGEPSRRGVSRHVASSPPPTVEPGDTGSVARRQRRIEQLRVIDRSLTESEAIELVDESDRILSSLQRDGIHDVDLTLRHEVLDTEVSDEELREYFEQHRVRFGDRSFEESRNVLATLVRLQKTRQAHGEAPPAGSES